MSNSDFERYATELESRATTFRTNCAAGWRLYWVQEESEIYVARSADEARQFVEGLQDGKPIPLDEVGEVVTNRVSGNHNPEDVILTPTLFDVLADAELTEPVQAWTAYN